MKSLTRKQFHDLSWNATDLDVATTYWLQLYDSAARTRKFSTIPRCTLEIRLSGFPRHDGEMLQAELEHRLQGSDFPHAKAELRDPNTLVLTVTDDLGDLPFGLGLPLLAGRPFERLAAEFRFCTTESGGRFKLGRVSSSLVIVGEFRGESLLVKAVWRCGPNGLDDIVSISEPPINEAPLLAGLQEFRETGSVQAAFAKKLFVPWNEDLLAGWMMKLCYFPPAGRPRLLRLLSRLVIFAALFTPFVWMISEIAEEDEWLWLIPLCGFGWLPLFMAGIFGFIEYKLLFVGYRLLRATYTEHYEDSAPYRILTPSEVAVLGDDPNVRKYTQECAAAGFKHFGDVGRTHAGEVVAVYRCFLAADGVTYLHVFFVRKSIHLNSEHRQSIWPAPVTFQSQTFFQSGGRVDTASGDANGYQRVPTDSSTLVRSVGEVRDPTDFYQNHVEAVAAFSAEKGLTPARQERIEGFVRQQEAIHEEERRHALDHPYSWWDHIRWYLQWPRKEQRG